MVVDQELFLAFSTVLSLVHTDEFFRIRGGTGGNSKTKEEEEEVDEEEDRERCRLFIISAEKGELGTGGKGGKS